MQTHNKSKIERIKDERIIEAMGGHGLSVGGELVASSEVRRTKTGLGVVEAENRAVARRKAKIMAKLEQYLEETPEDSIKHADIARYMRLIAELDGTIKTNKEEKHLHIHKENIDSLNEDQLRKRLRAIEEAKLSNQENGLDKPKEGDM